MKEKSILVGWLLLLASLSASSVSAQSSAIRKLMTPEEFRAAGLSRLTPAEEAALNAWLGKFARAVKRTLTEARGSRPRTSQPQHRPDTYQVEVSHNDELFVINGEKFEAQTYCFDVEVGDEVMFIEGSPFGACASATFVNLRTRETCEVWCE